MDIYSIKIGDTITPAMGLQIANHFGMVEIVSRIEAQPEMYKDFIFDGVSGLPENLASFLAEVDEEILTYEIALPHDVGYGYGEPGNDEEKEIIDIDFENRLIKYRCPKWKAKVAKRIVDILGKEELGQKFSWAFATKEKI